MQIVVDISRKYYEDFKLQLPILNTKAPSEVAKYAIATGIPLPKGHGRLIDADKLTDNILCKTFGLRDIDIENADTIIEAESEADNGNDEYCPLCPYYPQSTSYGTELIRCNYRLQKEGRRWNHANISQTVNAS